MSNDMNDEGITEDFIEKVVRRDIGHRIRDARLGAGLSQAELASLLNRRQERRSCPEQLLNLVVARPEVEATAVGGHVTDPSAVGRPAPGRPGHRPSPCLPGTVQAACARRRC